MRSVLLFITLLLASLTSAYADQKLTGTYIGSKCWDYSVNGIVANGQARAFDGNQNTYFATEERSYGWVGMDLGRQYVITKVGWRPRNESSVGEARVMFAVFQGANNADFTDAVPIYMITERGKLGTMDYADVKCSRGFRYVRYVGPSGSRCNVADIEFYGYAGIGDDSNMWQPTNLPTLCINTIDSQEPFDKETEIAGSVVIINNHTIDTDKPMTVRERGNASRGFPKKPWRIKFDKKTKVLGSPAEAKKWALVNNYGDKSLMRNIVAFEIARRVGMAYVPFCQPVDVFLNGEFKGNYQLCDKIDIRPGRVDIDEMTALDKTGDALTGGYLMEIDSYASGTDLEWFTSSKGIPITLHEPDLGVYLHYRYITNYFNEFEKKLYGTLFTSPTSGYRTMFDTESFLQHFIVNELAGNPDIYWSTYMYKPRLDPKIYTGPVWDFDLAFDNDSRVYPMNSKSTFLYQANVMMANKMDVMAKRILVDDRTTKNELSQLWSRLRNGGKITPEGFDAFIDKTYDEIKASADLNFARWPILHEVVHQNPRTPNTYEDEITFVKNFVWERVKKLDGADFMNLDPTVSSIDEIGVETDAEGINVSGRCISVDGNVPFRVVSTAGVTVFSGSGSTPELQSGIYIVIRSATPAVRILVR